MIKKTDEIIGIIPARYASVRFPGKPLIKILNKPMIQWVYEGAIKSKLLDRVYIATDDERIFNVANSFGGKAIMTSKKHKSGTDRIEEAARNLRASIIVNIQGDEPLISAKDIDKAIESLLNNKNINVSTLVRRFSDIRDVFDENKVKVVFDKEYNALYFSRNVIPFYKINGKNFQRNKSFGLMNKSGEKILLNNYYLHIGLYVYRKKFLSEFVKMKQSRLERIEQLEQLRILENGEKIKVVISNSTSFSIDTPTDLKMLLKKLKDK